MVYSKGETVELDIPEEVNLCDVIIDENIKKGRADKVALYFTGEPPFRPEETITYRELLCRVSKAGNSLKSLGLEVEDRVAIVLPDVPEVVEVFLGAIRMGAQPIVLSTVQTTRSLEYLLNDSKAKALVIHEPLRAILDNIKPDLRYLKHVIVVGEARADELGYREIVKEASESLEPEPLSKDDFCFWLYSSGTTGPPKGVIHLQHDALVSTDTYYKHVLNLREDDICFSTSKLFFAYGLGNTLYAPLRFGASSILYPGPPEPERVFDIIKKYKVTLFFSVPLVYLRLLAHLDTGKTYDLSSVRVCVSAGEALPAHVYEVWKRRLGLDILDGIGTTELTHIFISNRLGKVKPGSTGIPVPGYELKTVNDEGAEVPVNTVGRLLVKGDSLAAMYWRKHEKTKKTFIGEWFDTGDSYYMDEDGFFWHAGRTDDLIKSAGAWVSPVEVESVLIKHPAVLECAVVQSYTKDGIGRPKAFVVLKEKFQPSPELEAELKELVRRELLEPYRVPYWVEFTSELPKTPTGKIQRFKLRDMEREKLKRILP